MGKGQEHVRFFFATDAIKRFNTVFKIASGRFPDLFNNTAKDKYDAPERIGRNLIQNTIDHRELELMWVSNDNPNTQKEIEKMSLIEYYFRLNKKADDVKRSAKNKSSNMKQQWQNRS